MRLNQLDKIRKDINAPYDKIRKQINKEIEERAGKGSYSEDD